MKSVTISVLLVVFLWAAMLGANGATGVPSPEMTQLEMNKEYISRDGHWLMAFVPTGSTDKRVLVTINGHWIPNDRVDYVAAGAKVSELLGPGVQIWALTDSGKPFPPDTNLIVTVMQPGAKFGKPHPVDAPLKLTDP